MTKGQLAIATTIKHAELPRAGRAMCDDNPFPSMGRWGGSGSKYQLEVPQYSKPLVFVLEPSKSKLSHWHKLVQFALSFIELFDKTLKTTPLQKAKMNVMINWKNTIN